jgi:hypothetical protein
MDWQNALRLETLETLFLCGYVVSGRSAELFQHETPIPGIRFV